MVFCLCECPGPTASYLIQSILGFMSFPESRHGRSCTPDTEVAACRGPTDVVFRRGDNGLEILGIDDPRSSALPAAIAGDFPCSLQAVHERFLDQSTLVLRQDSEHVERECRLLRGRIRSLGQGTKPQAPDFRRRRSPIGAAASTKAFGSPMHKIIKEAHMVPPWPSPNGPNASCSPCLRTGSVHRHPAIGRASCCDSVVWRSEVARYLKCVHFDTKNFRKGLPGSGQNGFTGTSTRKNS